MGTSSVCLYWEKDAGGVNLVRVGRIRPSPQRGKKKPRGVPAEAKVKNCIQGFKSRQGGTVAI